MWDRPRPVSAASVAVLLAVLLVGIPAPTRGACEGDNATAVALCNSLVGTVLNSPFNATRIAYVCDPEVLYSDYRCLAMGMNHTIHARPHLMEPGTSRPTAGVTSWTSGARRSACRCPSGTATSSPRRGIRWNRASATTCCSDVRRHAQRHVLPRAMDHGRRLAQVYGLLTDCGLDDDDVFETAKNHPDGKLGRQLNRTMVLRMIRHLRPTAATPPRRWSTTRTPRSWTSSASSPRSLDRPDARRGPIGAEAAIRPSCAPPTKPRRAG